MRRLWILLALLPLTAWAGPVPCGHEPTVPGRVYCLQLRIDTLRNQIDARIAAATTGMTAATGPQLRRFERALRDDQRDWVRNTDRDCRARGGDRAMVAMCRLHRTRIRRTEVDDLLARARQRMGLPPLPPLIRDFEVLIPLPDPPAGPKARTRLPLTVPVPQD